MNVIERTCKSTHFSKRITYRTGLSRINKEKILGGIIILEKKRTKGQRRKVYGIRLQNWFSDRSPRLRL
jgi:hypothetical protein